MKLVWELFDDTFSLVEDENSDGGLTVICTSEKPSEIAQFSLTGFLQQLSVCMFSCRSPSNPDVWDVMYGELSENEYVKILEAEPIEYPEGAVF